MTTSNMLDFTEQQCRAIHRILDRMDRMSQRLEYQFSRLRKHDRKLYRGPLTVYLPTVDQPAPPEVCDKRCIPAWSYSLSQGGVGLIMLEETPWNEVWVGMHLPNKTVRWMYGRIVRRRECPEEEFLDYGICFTSRPEDDRSDAPTSARETHVKGATVS